jgi:hypothetical protein
MYKILLAIPLCLLLIAAPASAQLHVQQGPSVSDLPDKPETKAETSPEIHAQNPAGKPHFKVADKKFWVLATLEVGATVADFETTQWAQRVRPDGGEMNPLYGRHPGRARMYSIGMSLDAVQILMQYRSKAKAEGSGKAGKAWIVGALLNTGIHTFLAVHNGQNAGRGPGN